MNMVNEKMSEEQFQEFKKLYKEYAGDNGVMEGDEGSKMFEDMKKNHRELYNLMSPERSELHQKLLKLDTNAVKFFDRVKCLSNFWVTVRI